MTPPILHGYQNEEGVGEGIYLIMATCRFLSCLWSCCGWGEVANSSSFDEGESEEFLEKSIASFFSEAISGRPLDGKDGKQDKGSGIKDWYK